MALPALTAHSTCKCLPVRWGLPPPVNCPGLDQAHHSGGFAELRQTPRPPSVAPTRAPGAFLLHCKRPLSPCSAISPWHRPPGPLPGSTETRALRKGQWGAWKAPGQDAPSPGVHGQLSCSFAGGSSPCSVSKNAAKPLLMKDPPRPNWASGVLRGERRHVSWFQHPGIPIPAPLLGWKTICLPPFIPSGRPQAEGPWLGMLARSHVLRPALPHGPGGPCGCCHLMPLRADLCT